MYAEGDLQPSDGETSLQLLQKAAKQGNGYAEILLSEMYRYGGKEVSADEKKADQFEKQGIKHLQAAANQGDSYAQMALAEMYLFGKNGLPQDTAKAKQLLEKAVKHGNAAAQQILNEEFQ